MMGAVDPCLEVSKDPVNVGRMRPRGRGVAVVGEGGPGVPFPSIGADLRSFRHILREKQSYRLPVGPWRDGQTDAAGLLGGAPVLVGIADHFNGAENQCFVLRSRHAPTESPFDGAAYNRFVGFNVSVKTRPRVT